MGSVAGIMGDLTTTALLCLLVCTAAGQPLGEEDTHLTKDLCCVDARQQCGEWCGTKPCEETCTYYCGIFNTNCGTWTCEEVAGFSCTRSTTTTQPTPSTSTTPADCAATGGICYDSVSTPGTTVVKTCCLTTDLCKPVNSVQPYTCQAT